MATPDGRVNWLVPLPAVPHLVMKVPIGRNFSTRLLVASTTTTLSEGPIARSSGTVAVGPNWPSPVPAASPLGDEVARGVELLDPAVARVGDVDVAGGVDGDARGSGELAVAGADGSPLGDEGARGVELLDPVVAGVGDVDVARSASMAMPGRGRELAVAGPARSPRGDEGPGGVELLDPASQLVDDVGVARGVDGDAERAQGQELAVAGSEGAELALDRYQSS